MLLRKHLSQSLQQTRKRKKEATIRKSLRLKIAPLVFVCTDGMSGEYETFYGRLADSLAIKKSFNKSTVMGWLRAKLSFKLLHSVNICIRGSRARNVDEIKKKITLMI